MQNMQKIFGKKRRIVIGALHFPPLLGYKDFPGFSHALKNAVADLRALEAGGVDGVIFENNYDIPHREFVAPETIAAMTYLGGELRSRTKLPLGVSVLWNDYKTALSIAKVLGLQFVRVPVFVDTVQTSYGVIRGDAQDVVAYRDFIGAGGVALFADIHVKHSKILSRYSLVASARLALRRGADAVIVTGRWTADAPVLEDIKKVRSNIGAAPLFVGSGADAANISELFEFSSGVIVGTSLKKGKKSRSEVNVKGWNQRIDGKEVVKFMRAAQ